MKSKGQGKKDWLLISKAESQPFGWRLSSLPLTIKQACHFVLEYPHRNYQMVTKKEWQVLQSQKEGATNEI